MLINQGTAISTSSIILVPYEAFHVPTYHEWMQDEQIQAETASEPLSLSEEYAMQRSWRNDHDKLTFIICLPLPQPQPQSTPTSTSTSSSPDPSILQPGKYDGPSQMIGDVNLFLTPADEDDEGCIGELELMIAPTSARRKGFGRAAILTFLAYITTHLPSILSEYGAGQIPPVTNPRLLQLKVKIGSSNVKSIGLFSSVGFVKVGEGENYFGEVELVFEGFLGEERIAGLCDKFGMSGYEELRYGELSADSSGTQ